MESLDLLLCLVSGIPVSVFIEPTVGACGILIFNRLPMCCQSAVVIVHFTSLFIFFPLAIDVFDLAFMVIIWRLLNTKQLRRVLEDAVDDALHGNCLVVDVEYDRDFNLRAIIDEIDLSVGGHWHCPLLETVLLYQVLCRILTRL